MKIEFYNPSEEKNGCVFRSISTTLDNIKCLKDSILDIQSCTHAEYIDIEKSDVTEVSIIGKKIIDSYEEQIEKISIQEDSKIMKLVRKDN